jgi:hypothetical protein
MAMPVSPTPSLWYWPFKFLSKLTTNITSWKLFQQHHANFQRNFNGCPGTAFTFNFLCYNCEYHQGVSRVYWYMRANTTNFNDFTNYKSYTPVSPSSIITFFKSTKNQCYDFGTSTHTNSGLSLQTLAYYKWNKQIKTLTAIKLYITENTGTASNTSFCSLCMFLYM